MKVKVGKLSLHQGRSLYYARVNGKAKYAPREIQSEDEAKIWYAKLLLQMNQDDTTTTPNDIKLSILTSAYIDVRRKIDKKENWARKEQTMLRFNATFPEAKVGEITSENLLDFIQSTHQKKNGGGKKK